MHWCPSSWTSQRVGVQKDQWQYAYCVNCWGYYVLVFWVCDTRYSEGVGASEDVVLYGFGVEGGGRMIVIAVV